MVLRKRITEQWVRTIMIVLLTVMGVYSCALHAQNFKPIKYVGFEACFGVRSFNVSSNLAQINGMHGVHEGGSLGLTFGNDILKAKVRAAGFYYSNANTPQTQELFETATLVNFYPLSFIRNEKTRLFPYLTAGISMDNIKFFGTYLSDQYSSSPYEPFLGKITQVNATAGFGLEYHLPSDFDFIHLFAEVLHGTPIQSAANRDVFNNTSIRQFTSISVGVSFGRHR